MTAQRPPKTIPGAPGPERRLPPVPSFRPPSPAAARPYVLVLTRRDSLVALIKSSLDALSGAPGLETATDLDAGMRLLVPGRAIVALLDLELASLPSLSGLARCRARSPQVPVVLVADGRSEASLRSALGRGAMDYLLTEEIHPRSLDRSLRMARRAARGTWPEAMSEQLQHLLELLPCPVVVVDAANFEVIYANPRVGPAFGVPSRQLLGRDFEEFLPEAGTSTLLLGTVASQGRVDDISLTLRRTDGRTRPVRLSALPLSYEGRQGLLLFLYEAASSGGEGSLMPSSFEESLREFFEENLSGNFRASASGEILACNRAFNQILGLHPVAPGETFVLQQFYPDEATYAKFIAALTERGRLEHYELEMQRPDGSRVDVIQNVVAKYDQRGSLHEIRGYIFDITEHKRTERQLRQAQKMEAVGLLAGGIAHDFNNLLTAITGYSELMLSRTAEGDPFRHDLEEISKAGDRAAVLIRQLLAFSRRQILLPEVLNLNLVVQEMERLLRRVVGEQVELVLRLQPELGTVKADRGQIEQVIVNLLVNARDAMPGGGRLLVETSNLELSAPLSRPEAEVPKGSYVLLRIQDSGTGIDAEILPRIFEPFFTTKEKGKGTGLGLSTVYGIIKQSNGFIFVESGMRTGTTFDIYLSRLDSSVPAPNEDESPPRPKLEGSETILLVEDEAAVRDLASLTLQMKGYQLLVAKDGEEALHIWELHRDQIDLIVTDVVMPHLSGRELVQRTLEQRPEIKVLFLSGYTDEAVGSPTLSDSNLAFMSKPFTPSSLAAKVREVLDQRPRRKP